MDSKQKQQAIIEFLMKKGYRLSDIHKWLTEMDLFNSVITVNNL